jgi:hypothetical protein
MDKPPMQNLDFQEVQLREYREAEARAYQENPVMAVAPPGPPQYYPQPYPPQNPPVVYASPYPAATPYPPAPYSGQPYPYPGQPYPAAAVISIVQPQMVVPIQEPPQLTEETHKLVRLSRILRYAALVNLLVDILFAVTVPGLILLFLLNIVGYFAARRVVFVLAVLYGVYLGLTVIGRIVLMAIFPYPYVIIIYVLACVFEVLLIAGFVVFFVRIHRVGESGRNRVLSYLTSIQSNSPCCFI